MLILAVLSLEIILFSVKMYMTYNSQGHTDAIYAVSVVFSKVLKCPVYII